MRSIAACQLACCSLLKVSNASSTSSDAPSVLGISEYRNVPIQSLKILALDHSNAIKDYSGIVCRFWSLRRNTVCELESGHILMESSQVRA
jgi:hypothetical protein